VPWALALVLTAPRASPLLSPWPLVLPRQCGARDVLRMMLLDPPSARAARGLGTRPGGRAHGRTAQGGGGDPVPPAKDLLTGLRVAVNAFQRPALFATWLTPGPARMEGGQPEPSPLTWCCRKRCLSLSLRVPCYPWPRPYLSNRCLLAGKEG